MSHQMMNIYSLEVTALEIDVFVNLINSFIFKMFICFVCLFVCYKYTCKHLYVHMFKKEIT